MFAPLRALAGATLAAALSTFAFASASAATPQPTPVATAAASCANAATVPTSANRTTIRKAVLCLINAERTKAGRRALSNNARLQTAADRHSADMVSLHYFSHTSTNGRSPGARIASTGYRSRTWGENIGWGTGSLSTPAQIVRSWMNSPGHRANILSGKFRKSGIGVAIGTPSNGSGATYTQDFGTR
jgi:uncharacterized protein YkwD